MIDTRADKSTQKKEMCRMNLHAVKAANFSTNRRVNEHFYNSVHIFNSHIVFANFDGIFIERSQSNLTNRRAIFCVNNFYKLFVLRNQFIVAKSHHAAKIKIVRRNTCKAGYNCSYATFCKFAVNFIGIVGNGAVNICKTFPRCRTYKTIF